jgi:hypothetical protein
MNEMGMDRSLSELSPKKDNHEQIVIPVRILSLA